jgi:hypothetical protein
VIIGERWEFRRREVVDVGREMSRKGVNHEWVEKGDVAEGVNEA